MIDVADVQSRLKLTGLLQDVEANRKILDKFIAEIETADRVIRALVQANQGTCRHSSVRLGKDNLNWCDYCGKCMTTGH